VFRKNINHLTFQAQFFYIKKEQVKYQDTRMLKLNVFGDKQIISHTIGIIFYRSRQKTNVRMVLKSSSDSLSEMITYNFSADFK
jgi:hypothetical protein